MGILVMVHILPFRLPRFLLPAKHYYNVENVVNVLLIMFYYIEYQYIFQISFQKPTFITFQITAVCPPKCFFFVFFCFSRVWWIGVR